MVGDILNTGMIILIILLLLLVGAIFIVSIKMFAMNEQLSKLKNTNQKVKSLSILQDFMEIMGDNSITTIEKMNKINNSLIEKYEIKYSTIVVFDGTKYKIESSNVGEKHWKTFEELHGQDIFMESIKNATPKYITAKQGEKLPYLRMEFERAKSAIFFPMYVDNLYIGYWLIEGNKTHEFDNVDTTILDIIKNNLISAIRIIRSQRTLENMGRIDEVTGIHTYEYLYGNIRKTIDKYPTSIVSLLKIINLQQIEDKISKKTADSVLVKITDYIKQSLSPEYILVKYNENEFVIVFSGSDAEGVANFLEDLKQNIEKIKVKTIGSLKETMNGLAVTPKLNISMTSYYKETALEEILNTLENYLKEADPSESDITCL